MELYRVGESPRFVADTARHALPCVVGVEGVGRGLFHLSARFFFLYFLFRLGWPVGSVRIVTWTSRKEWEREDNIPQLPLYLGNRQREWEKDPPPFFLVNANGLVDEK